MHDAGHGGVGNDVVNYRRLAKQASDGRHRRLGANLASAAFEAFEQGCFLAADVGAGADEEFELEGVFAAEDVAAQDALLVGAPQGDLEGAFGVGVFGAQVHETLGGAGGDGGDGHALDQSERVAFEQEAIGEGARISFVGVADEVFLLAGGVADGAPLDVGGEAGTAAAAKAGGLDFVDQGVGVGVEAGFEGDGSRQGQRVIGSAAVEDDSMLAGEPVDVIHVSETLGMRLALLEDVWSILCRDVAPRGSHASFVGQFHHRFGPRGTPRAGANDAQSTLGEGVGHRIGAAGDGRHVLWDVDDATSHAEFRHRSC